MSFSHQFSTTAPDNSGSNSFSSENAFSIYLLKCWILKALRQKLCLDECNRRVLYQQSWILTRPRSWPFLCVKRGIPNWCRLSLLHWSSWSSDILNQLEICSMILSSLLNLSAHFKKVLLAFFFFWMRKYLRSTPSHLKYFLKTETHSWSYCNRKFGPVIWFCKPLIYTSKHSSL